MNSVKIAALAVVMAAVAGSVYFNRSHTNIPSDLRDAVADNRASHDFDTAIPTIEVDDTDIPASKAILPAGIDTVSPGIHPLAVRLVKPSIVRSYYPISSGGNRHGAIDPRRMNRVNEAEFNRLVMPFVRNLAIFSYTLNRWFTLTTDFLTVEGLGIDKDSLFAMKAAIDAFLWHGKPLIADMVKRGEKELYLPIGFKRANYKGTSWIETATIVLAGNLKYRGMSLASHEAIAINTDKGVRILDPLFRDHLYTPTAWVSLFLEDSSTSCSPMSANNLKALLSSSLGGVLFEEYNSLPRNPVDTRRARPCGYAFFQRTENTNTIFEPGAAARAPAQEEKRLSELYYGYFENDLSKLIFEHYMSPEQQRNETAAFTRMGPSIFSGVPQQETPAERFARETMHPANQPQPNNFKEGMDPIISGPRSWEDIMGERLSKDYSVFFGIDTHGTGNGFPAFAGVVRYFGNSQRSFGIGLGHAAYITSLRDRFATATSFIGASDSSIVDIRGAAAYAKIQFPTWWFQTVVSFTGQNLTNDVNICFGFYYIIQ